MTTSFTPLFNEDKKPNLKIGSLYETYSESTLPAFYTLNSTLTIKSGSTVLLVDIEECGQQIRGAVAYKFTFFFNGENVLYIVSNNLINYSCKFTELVV